MSTLVFILHHSLNEHVAASVKSNSALRLPSLFQEVADILCKVT